MSSGLRSGSLPRLLARSIPGISSAVLAVAAASAGPALAQTHPGHDAHAAPATAMLCGLCPASREASGTSWQPDTSELHGIRRGLGVWQLSAHGDIAIVSAREDGPRGANQSFSTNHVMVRGSRPVGAGVIGLRTMWSLEPTTGKEGYPLLLQNGETADGLNALVDRQHPHDLTMELAVTYARATGPDRAFFVYLAAVGEPALGPPAFMHRASAAVIPVAPIGHHWLDSSHISYGVVTAGFIPERRVKFEASAFRGREPDQEHWGFEAPALDSFAFRASINPSPTLALQVSAGRLSSPEQIHPGADVTRLTASAMWSRAWTAQTRLDASVAWGRNHRERTISTLPGGFLHVVAGRITQAFLGEATLQAFERHGIGLRVERADKDELFSVSDPRHNLVFTVSRLTAGYQFDVLRWHAGRLGLGAAVSWIDVPGAIEGAYGDQSVSPQGFLRLRVH